MACPQSSTAAGYNCVAASRPLLHSERKEEEKKLSTSFPHRMMECKLLFPLALWSLRSYKSREWSNFFQPGHSFFSLFISLCQKIRRGVWWQMYLCSSWKMVHNSSRSRQSCGHHLPSSSVMTERKLLLHTCLTDPDLTKVFVDLSKWLDPRRLLTIIQWPRQSMSWRSPWNWWPWWCWRWPWPPLRLPTFKGKAVKETG